MLIYNCGIGPDLGVLNGPGINVVTLQCVGQLPPSFLDFVISRGYADGVFLTGCRAGNCHYRLGIDWTEQRMRRQRDPYLRERVPRERVEISWAGVDQLHAVSREVNEFRERLRRLQSVGTTYQQPVLRDERAVDHA